MHSIVNEIANFSKLYKEATIGFVPRDNKTIVQIFPSSYVSLIELSIPNQLSIKEPFYISNKQIDTITKIFKNKPAEFIYTEEGKQLLIKDGRKTLSIRVNDYTGFNIDYDPPFKFSINKSDLNEIVNDSFDDFMTITLSNKVLKYEITDEKTAKLTGYINIDYEGNDYTIKLNAKFFSIVRGAKGNLINVHFIENKPIQFRGKINDEIDYKMTIALMAD